MIQPPKISVRYVDLGAQHEPLRAELLEAVSRVLKSGAFILGDEVAAFETELARYCGVKYAVSVANGTDALILSLKAIGLQPGEEVITAPNSFLASASAIALAGGRPVFADVRDDLNIDPARLEAAITPKTRALIPVHLTGRPADMEPILAIARKHHLAVIEDAAQAIGARYQDRPIGSQSNAATFSFHPLKNLNACGDGGAIITNDDAMYTYLLKARNHGLVSRDECAFWTFNSRLDAMQAAMLRVKLKHLPTWTEARRRIAAAYRAGLSNYVRVPHEQPYEYAVYHTFVVLAERRDELMRHLLERGIETKVHYPIPIHLQEAARGLGYRHGNFPVTERLAGQILSLPIYPHLSTEQQRHVIDSVRSFYER
jgi:dTDP-4-amino-4,6-dideoxygalactose transaminase